MELKSHHLLLVAVAVLIVGIFLGLAAGNAFPVIVPSGSLYRAPEVHFNTYLFVAIFISGAFSALILWFFSTVLFYLEKNRNFNRKTIELLEKIVEQQAAHTSFEALEQSAKVAAAE